MKYFTLVYLNLLLTINSYADITFLDDFKLFEDANFSLKVDTSINEKNIKKCTQQIAYSTVHGDIIQNCINYIEKFPKTERRKLDKLTIDIEQVNYDIKKFKNYDDTELQHKIQKSKIKLSELNEKYLHYKKEILEVSRLIEKIKHSNNHEFYTIKNKIKKIEEDNEVNVEIIEDLGYQININKNSIVLIESRVDLIENDLNFLMDEYLHGNLKSISFYSLSIGSLMLNNTTYTTLGLEYERFLNPIYSLSHLSLFATIAKLTGDKEIEYSTLSGLNNETISTASDFYSVELGAKTIVKKVDNYGFYTGSSIGWIDGDEETLTGSLFLGTELYHKYNKFSVEVAYKYFNQILNRDVNFNFLGQSEDSIKKVSEHGLFVQVKFSVR